MGDSQDNPFTVQTPEDISAEDAVSIFVDVFTDFYKIPKSGHTFINGPRGSGKSMMFRYLQPDCQSLAQKKSLSELGFYGAYIPIKNTDLKLTELIRLENDHASVILNEHFMTMYSAVKIFGGLLRLTAVDAGNSNLESARTYVKDTFFRLLTLCGWMGNDESADSCQSTADCLKLCEETCDNLYREVLHYLRQLSFKKEIPVYNGPLCGYLDFLLPILKGLKSLRFMPKGPIYLLLDDADNLNLVQTQILNSWVSSRTSSEVSLKISTQLNYKTYRTVTGATIDTPHDYSDVDIATIYTSSRDKYKERVQKIVEVRLKLAGIDSDAYHFFPWDEEQESKIAGIANGIRANFEEHGRGNRVSDDVVRYARPNYIRELRGTSKSGYTYSYAGFEQLVHISDGLIRFFLEPASLMFSEEQGLNPQRKVTQIRSSIQHKIVFQQAELLMFQEFDKMKQEPTKDPTHLRKVQKLGNLIRALGGTFRAIMLSERSERKVFSIAFSDTPDDEVSSVLELGLKYGYFHCSTIGNKEGTGRTKLYVLTRRLAPVFTLDVTGFAGYLFVTSNSIRLAMHNPAHMLRRLDSMGIDGFFSATQLELFD